MKEVPIAGIDRFRRVHPQLGSSPDGEAYGYFEVSGLRIISSGPQEGWEHVSVSLPSRCPTWKEMCFVKSLFWKEDETVIQYHPKDSEYVNVHDNCLHLWKKMGVDYELPPIHFV